MAQDDSFTLDESIAAQKALRASLVLKEEVFEHAEFVGMISDEIEQHRKAGKSDQDIAAIIEQANASAPRRLPSITRHRSSGIFRASSRSIHPSITR